MTEPVLEMVAVSKWYGQVAALSEITLRLDSGVIGLVGQNGAGKSTFLKLSVGVLDASQGEVRVLGRSPRRASVRRYIGFASDLDRYYERLSGLAFVTWMLRLSGVSGARKKAAEVLDRLGLADAMHRPIAGYSKGMRQRVKLAQALGHTPRLILLDEPMTGLDPVARAEMADRIRGLGREAVVVVSSHVLQELEAVVDHVVLLHQGRLMAEGSVSELREQIKGHPRKVRLKSTDPRELAARLSHSPFLRSVAYGEDELHVEVSGHDELYAELTKLGAEGLVQEIVATDEGLDSVFGYLVTG